MVFIIALLYICLNAKFIQILFKLNRKCSIQIPFPCGQLRSPLLASGTSLICRKAWLSWMLSTTSAMQCTQVVRATSGRMGPLLISHVLIDCIPGMGVLAVLLCSPYSQVCWRSHQMHESCNPYVGASSSVGPCSLYGTMHAKIKFANPIPRLFPASRAGKALAVEKKIQLQPQSWHRYTVSNVWSRSYINELLYETFFWKRKVGKALRKERPEGRWSWAQGSQKEGQEARWSSWSGHCPLQEGT